MWAEYKWTVENWEQFWKEIVEASDNREQLKKWRKQRHEDLEKRHIRRIINF